MRGSRYTTLEEVPSGPDLAIVALAAEDVLSALAKCYGLLALELTVPGGVLLVLFEPQRATRRPPDPP
jgi:hypothetical protein